MFASSTFEDVSLNQWLRRLTPQMVKEHLGFDTSTLAHIPAEKLGIV
jgi:oxalate decarboxylase